MSTKTLIGENISIKIMKKLRYTRSGGAFRSGEIITDDDTFSFIESSDCR